MHPDYYEGILQLRSPNKELVSFVRKNAGGLITKEKKVTNGIDFYFISQRALRALGKNLNKKFSGILKESRKLHTRKRITSKDVYRVNVMFRLIDIRRNKIITYKGEKVKIKSIGKLISGVNLDTGKKVSFRAEEI